MEYTHEIKQCMIQQNEHSKDFKTLVLRLLTLYSDNVKLVSAIVHVPETVILKWKSEWNTALYRSAQIDFVSDSSVI